MLNFCEKVSKFKITTLYNSIVDVVSDDTMALIQTCNVQGKPGKLLKF